MKTKVKILDEIAGNDMTIILLEKMIAERDSRNVELEKECETLAESTRQLEYQIVKLEESRLASIKASLENAWIKAESIHCGLKMKNAITDESNIVIVE